MLFYSDTVKADRKNAGKNKEIYSGRKSKVTKYMKLDGVRPTGVDEQ